MPSAADAIDRSHACPTRRADCVVCCVFIVCYPFQCWTTICHCNKATNRPQHNGQLALKKCSLERPKVLYFARWSEYFGALRLGWLRWRDLPPSRGADVSGKRCIRAGHLATGREPVGLRLLAKPTRGTLDYGHGGLAIPTRHRRLIHSQEARSECDVGPTSIACVLLEFRRILKLALQRQRYDSFTDGNTTSSPRTRGRRTR